MMQKTVDVRAALIDLEEVIVGIEKIIEMV